MRRVALLACLCACVNGGDDLGGQLEVMSDEYGSWTMSPTTCASGERQLFFGADLTEDGDVGRGVRIVLDAVDGYTLLMNIPGEELALSVGEDDGCETFDILVRRTNVRINNIWAVEGHAVVKCVASGVSIEADLSFSGCA